MLAVISGWSLKKVREHWKMSQQDLADRSGVSISTIKRIESSSREYECRLNEANKLAKVFGLEIEDFSERSFQEAYDIGGDVVLSLDEKDWDEAKFRSGMESLIKMMNRRVQMFGVKRPNNIE